MGMRCDMPHIRALAIELLRCDAPHRFPFATRPLPDTQALAGPNAFIYR